MKIETKKGLWVSSNFTEKFGTEIKPSKDIPPFKVLAKAMTGPEIIKEYGTCEIGDVAAFLKNPPKGTDDGKWNLFHIPGYVVRVDWNADSRGWDVDGWRLGVVLWGAGGRVFLRNSPSETLPSETGTLDSLTLRVKRLEDIISKVSDVTGTGV